MKKIKLLTLVFATVILLTNCKKKETEPTGAGETAWFEPENKQRSLLLNYTATWCTYCGSWGHPTFKAALNGLNDNAFGIAIQASGSDLIAYQYKPNNDTPFVSRFLFDMISSINNVNVSGYPTLAVNNKSGYGGGAQNSMIADANSYNANAPIANINFGITKTATGFTAKTTTKFFKETSGDYYINMFVTENKINNKQNVGGTYVDPYEHNNIPRAYAISNAKEVGGQLNGMDKTFGNAIATGSIASGKFINTELSFTADNKNTMLNPVIKKFTWNKDNTENLFVTAIVWKKESNGKYTFINGVRKPL